jgi:hypothetical protein
MTKESETAEQLGGIFRPRAASELSLFILQEQTLWLMQRRVGFVPRADTDGPTGPGVGINWRRSHGAAYLWSDIAQLAADKEKITLSRAA